MPTGSYRPCRRWVPNVGGGETGAAIELAEAEDCHVGGREGSAHAAGRGHQCRGRRVGEVRAGGTEEGVVGPDDHRSRTPIGSAGFKVDTTERRFWDFGGFWDC
ncbi:hypothetical protein MRB53_030635 [Persea americana]|uniref:Uncharacterized protein n=1 Tax=Persea americana TaxID=3435 RepID=A0ACC2KLR6_PERAE|nr:hypothetical protein MRB53_030635 [Persea americana]